ncbi:MAG: hypothetical protein ACT4NP_01860 [Pseudonocardiales bacterium]
MQLVAFDADAVEVEPNGPAVDSPMRTAANKNRRIAFKCFRDIVGPAARSANNRDPHATPHPAHRQ